MKLGFQVFDCFVMPFSAKHHIMLKYAQASMEQVDMGSEHVVYNGGQGEGTTPLLPLEKRVEFLSSNLQSTLYFQKVMLIKYHDCVINTIDLPDLLQGYS